MLAGRRSVGAGSGIASGAQTGSQERAGHDQERAIGEDGDLHRLRLVETQAKLEVTHKVGRHAGVGVVERIENIQGVDVLLYLLVNAEESVNHQSNHGNHTRNKQNAWSACKIGVTVITAYSRRIFTYVGQAGVRHDSNTNEVQESGDHHHQHSEYPVRKPRRVADAAGGMVAQVFREKHAGGPPLSIDVPLELGGHGRPPPAAPLSERRLKKLMGRGYF